MSLCVNPLDNQFSLKSIRKSKCWILPPLYICSYVSYLILIISRVSDDCLGMIETGSRYDKHRFHHYLYLNAVRPLNGFCLFNAWHFLHLQFLICLLWYGPETGKTGIFRHLLWYLYDDGTRPRIIISSTNNRIISRFAALHVVFMEQIYWITWISQKIKIS